MERALWVLSAVALVFAGVVFVLCLAQLLQGKPTTERDAWLPVKDRLKQARHIEKGSETTLSPLVKQAEAFALYLSPPLGQKSGEVLVPTRGQTQNTSSADFSKATPKFKLLATSCYRSRPKESMALISEPGSGVRWVKHGARLGHFVVESIKPGAILYRDGDALGEMVTDTEARVDTGKVSRTTAASTRSGVFPLRPLSLRRSNTRGSKLLHKLGLPRSETQPVAYDHQVGNSGR